ncbi:MAG: outer membrane beta-barrel protein [Prevotellaceae bacterium]|jgi:hypothetical protein|nr:outer membrane beta-barrel protein [Prevotellaceae bacterium]
MRHILFIAVYICLSGQLIAQSITGKVVDEKNNPLPYVSIILRSIPDSVYVGGVATNSEGTFALPIKIDTEYALSVSYIGYKTVNRTCKAGDIGVIVMKEDAMMLEEVSVVASRTRHDADGYTVNLRSSEIIKGKQSTDALVFLPGISREDGSFKINGLLVSEIYVDGVKLANVDELKNIPADMIDRVKVNYLAGSNQNAALTGGTIAITLRQPPQGGYYGALTGGATLYPAYGFSDEDMGGVLFYRYKNLSIYDNLSLTFNQPEETAEQTVWNQSPNLRTQIEEETKHRGYNVNNRLSLTQQINDKNSIGVSYYIATNRLKSSSMTVADGINAIRSAIDSRNNYLDQEATVKYTSALGRRGTTLEIVGDYFNRQSDNRSNYSYSDNTSSASEDESSLNMYKLSVDLTDPRSQQLVWKYGASIQAITSDYTPTLGTADGSDRFPTSRIATRTTGLTPLAYVSAMGQVRNIRYSVGLNWQLNKIAYKTWDNGTQSSDTQWGFNPTIQLMTPLDKTGRHALMLNYKRTLDDIPYAAISSTIRWNDPYNYTVGNPDLKSPTADMVMAGVSMFRNVLNLTAMYARLKGNIYWETMQSPNAPNIFYTTPINLPSANAYGIGAELSLNPLKVWRMKASGRLEILPENVTLGGIYYGETRLRQYYSMYNTFALRHGWGGMLNLIFEPTFKTHDRTYHTVYNIGGQVYKTLFKDKLQFTLIFNALGDRRKYDRFANGSKITYDFTTPVQNVGISIVWKFSGGKQVNVNAVESGSQNYKEIKDSL